MAQYALSNLSATNFGSDWSEGAGDGDSAHADEMDEGFGSGRGSGSGPDGATSYWENTGTLAVDIACGLSAVTDPAVSTGHIVRSNSGKHATGGQQIDITYGLWDASGSANHTTWGLYAETTVTNVDVFAVRSFTLTGGEADSITDYGTNQLGIKTQGDSVGGGSPKNPVESAMEFECPDAAVVDDFPLLPKPVFQNTLLRM